MGSLNQRPIVAIATAPGRGGIGVVRVSGPHLGPFIYALLGMDLEPRQATYCRFPDAAGNAIDQGIALYFIGPASYTGEDVLELQGHGGPAVLQQLLNRCLTVGAPFHISIASPGEFTLRAFLNDKIDLAQAPAQALTWLSRASTWNTLWSAWLMSNCLIIRSLAGATLRQSQHRGRQSRTYMQ